MTIIPERDVTAEMGETIDLLRADVELLKRVVKERDVTITRLREVLSDLADTVADGGKWTRGNRLTRAWMTSRIKTALTDTDDDWLERQKEGWLVEAKKQLESEKGPLTMIPTGTLEMIKAEIRAQERERCAGKCDEICAEYRKKQKDDTEYHPPSYRFYYHCLASIAEECASAIREADDG